MQIGKFFPVKGGIELSMLLIGRELNRRGFRCDALMAGNADVPAPDHPFLIREKTWLELAATHVCPGMVSRLAEIQNDYDLIHVHHPDPMAAFAVFLCRPRAKVVLHWHCDIVRQRTAYFFFRPLERWLLGKASRVICTTPEYASSSAPLADFSEKIRTLPLWCKALPEAKPTAFADSLRGRFGGKKVILSVGRFTHYKGFRHLIEAAANLPEDYRALIAGDGKLRPELEGQIERLKLGNKVILLGRLSDGDLISALNFCDVFCFPSVNRVEAFGLAMLEAMQLGKPVVATRIPGSGVTWVNRHGETGLNVEPADSKALAAALREVAENEKLYRRFSAGARKRYESLRPESIIPRLLEIYREALGA